MDRFIALGIDTKKLDNAGLKSNMDRFIAQFQPSQGGRRKRFKIQYG